ncbi:lipoate--protein ligase [Alkalibacter mobilis]|uniref:lipoate--protein ligase n=1 Tax=Alkalibacter mobilis TaxID=2787712 RepID=UPI0018A10CC6|nr:lipoate--protein ligase [Alkalibacter mobilis]MBF7097729.1 lipoate--protein ligase [Alkalibacter mobilis]
MKYIKTNWNIPYYNMAFEEYLINKMPEDDYLFFYIHDPSIIVGKHQNTLEEVNKEYIDTNDIYVSRRLSGGGAVYHDEGNLNFSFVMKEGNNDINNFKKFTQPIILALEKIGIKSELSGRNDITIDGKKFSGNAQYAKKNRLLHHGTLLFDSQMGNLSNALNVKELKIKSKGVKSVKSRVTNIKPYMKKDITINEFQEYLLEYMSELNNLEELVISDSDINKINTAVEKKFSTWEWNWGESPQFDIQKIDKFDCGIIDARMNIYEGNIEECKLYGDFFVKKPIEELENILFKVKYRKEDVKEALEKVNIEDFFFGLDKEDFINFICEQ